MRSGWRLCVLSVFLSFGGHTTPLWAQQPLLPAEKPQLLRNFPGGNSKVSIAGAALDAAGNIYLAGATSSADLRTERAVQTAYGGGTDAFIAKLDPAGNVLYASYLGGGAQDWATGIAVDSANNAYVTGWTASTDFPTLSAAQSSLRGRRNGFVAKFGPEGVLIYSTYLGGTGDDSAAAIAVDSQGNAYVTGATASPDFPVVGAIQTRSGGGIDAFVTKLGAFGDIRYSTYIGGGALDRGQGIAVDSTGRAYIAGVTASYDFPFKNPFRGYSGGTDGFVARLNAAGDGLEYATWIGGSGNEEVSGVAVDSLGRAYVTGWTDSRDFPLVHPLQDSLRGREDAFAIRLTPTGDGLSYSTYLGGSGTDRGLAIAVDATSSAYVTGWTRSPDFPASGAAESNRNVLQKAWLAELSPAGTLDYDTSVGSGEADEGRAVALAASGDIFVVGETWKATNQEEFLVRFSPAERAPLNLTETHGTIKPENPKSLSTSGIISTNTTWHLTDSPIAVTGNVEIASGTTLTIEAGVTVQFAAGTVLQVDGQLIARGTAASGIVFTSSQATPAPGQWGYVLFNSDSVGASFDTSGNYVAGSILEYVSINSAGANVGGSGSNYAVSLAGATPFINFATIQQNSGAGININNPATSLVKVANSTLNNNDTGVIANVGGPASTGGTVVLQGNTITNNTTGVNLNTYAHGAATLTGNVISNNNGAGVAVSDTSYGSLTVANNTIRGNQAGIFVGSSCCGANVSITGNLVQGNTPSGGITIVRYPSPLVISGNVIAGNTNTIFYGEGPFYSSGSGGGIWINSDPNDNDDSNSGTITNNIVSNNTAPVSAGGIYLNWAGNATIQQNSITGNTAPTYSGLNAVFNTANSYPISTNTITQNTITQNQATEAGGSAIAINNVKSNLTLSQNNWHNNAATYTLENLSANTTPVLNAQNNWWGTTNTTAIQSLIYDFSVDGSRGVVAYAPALGAINTTVPVSPPANVVAAAATGSVSLSWAANPEPNIAGYKVYYGAQPGPPYQGTGATQGPSPVDVGNVTSFALSNLPPGVQYLAVTAYNASHTGGATDQTNGFESAFANFSTLQTITFGALSDVTFGSVPITISGTASSNLAVTFASTTPPVCTVSGSTVTIAGAGVCSITASQAGNSLFAAAANVVESFTVMQASQTITFGTLANITFGAAAPLISATASSTLVVKFTSNTTAVCTVSGNTVTIVTPGACTIQADQAGNANYLPAPAFQQSFTIGPEPQSITLATPASLTYGAAPFTIQATVSSGLPVTFTGGARTVCAVAGDLVTVLGTGTCSIRASQAGNVDFSPITLTEKLTVKPANPSGTLAAAEGSPIAVGTGSFSVAVGDFNGDGVPDIATANFSDSNVTILLGNGTGGFSPAMGSPFPAGMSPAGVAVGDFNGDGIQDLAVANAGSSDVTILLGNGSGGFNEATGSPFAVGVEGTAPLSVAVADFNGDGIADLATANAGGGNVTILLGNGSGGFSAATGSPFAAGTNPRSVAVEDFNRDGIPDVVIANSGSADVTVLLGNGSGGFSAATGSPFAVGTSPFSVVVGDFNGDGFADLATANSGSGDVTVLLGNGSGGFGAATGSPFAIKTDPWSVAVGDFNGDGIPDLVTSNYLLNNVTVLLGNGSGGFSVAAGSAFPAGTLPYFVAVGDFNGDGRTDLVAANYSSNNVTVLLGAPAITTAQLTTSVPTSIAAGTAVPLTLAVGDSSATAFNAPTGTATFSDGSKVLGVATETTSPYTFNATGLALGTHTLTATYSGDARSTSSASGSLTITVTSLPPSISSLTPSTARAGGPAFTLTVNGSNFISGTTLLFGETALSTTFVNATQLTALVSAAEIASAGPVAVIVMNPDSSAFDASTFTINPSTATTTIVFATSGQWVFGQAITLAASVSPTAATGKVTFYEGTSVLGIGTLAGGITQITTNLLPSGPGTIKAYYGGDAIYAPSTSVLPGVRTVTANPSGTLTQAGGSPIGVGTNPRSGAVGDFNLDGIQDLATANQNGNVTVLLGNGSGGFSAAVGSPFAAGENPYSVVVGDFNGDGIQDLAVANSVSDDVTILLGNGSGGFSAATGSPFAAGTAPVSVAVGDFNADGIQDLAVANEGGGNVTILLGNGSGGFSAATGSPFAVGTDPDSVVVGDFNGDGFADLATANQLSDNVTVLLGNGSGGFSAAPGSPFAVGTYPYSVAVGDFNGDGIQDLATANFGSNDVTVLLGNGSGGFSADPNTPFAVGSNPSFVAVGDFNGDGTPDLATTNMTGDQGVTVLLGNGAGGFSAATGSPFAAGTGPHSMVAGEFNGGGRTDLAIVNFDSSNITVLLGGSAATGSVLSTTAPSSVAAGTPVPLTLTVSDSVTAFNAPTGTATFSDGSNVLGVATQTTSPYAFNTTGLAVGSHTLTATYGGDTRSLGSKSNTITIQVLLPQTIAFGALPAQIIGAPPFTLNAPTSSGLAVTFASNSTGVCTVVGATVTLVAAGTCSITASQPGDNVTYGPAAPVTVTFTVDPSFGDVSNADESAAFVAAIDDMLTKGITSGCQAVPLEYCPSQDVTRGQMAVFIILSIYGTNDFTYNPTPYFTDATPASVGAFFPFIQKMHELGITSGCTTTTYCPGQNVTRGQMAVFIILARYGTSLEFDYSATPYFSDATTASVGGFFKYIQRMKQDQITSGCSKTNYCPDQNVTRDQMAVFMMVGGFNQLLPPTAPIISSASPATGGLGETINVTLTGANTNFAQGMTTVSVGAGLTVGTVTVNSLTSLTVQLTIAANATPNPMSFLVTTPVAGGAEEVVLPNGFTITSDPAAGVVGYWTGNNTTVDSISNLSGTLINGATYASATSRTQGLADAQAFSLNGTNSYVQAASGETGVVSGARTLAAWVYPSTSSGLGMPIITGGSALAASDIFGITGTTGTCSSGGPYQLYVDYGGTACYVSDISLAPGVWSFVTATFDGSKVVFYIDGVASVTVAKVQMNSYGVSTYEIGGNTLGGTSSGASFNGLLSEVQVYGRALSAVEIQGLYAP